VIEKTLKAFYVRDNKEQPPKIHNLVRLAEKTTLNLTKEQKQLLAEINHFNIEARYPEEKQSFFKLCTAEFTNDYFTKIKELYKWLLKNIRH
jgi:HEPN domain-containing protein